jgi:hypothetical protein
MDSLDALNVQLHSGTSPIAVKMPITTLRAHHQTQCASAGAQQIAQMLLANASHASLHKV